MAKSRETEIKVGLFVTIGVGLIMLAILMLGGTENYFTQVNRYTTHFPSVEGLIPGAKVVLGGINVGAVEEIDLDPETREAYVKFNVQKKYEAFIRNDSFAEISTQGVLGDKFITMSMGTADSPSTPDGGIIPSRPVKDIAQFISKSDQLMHTLNNIAGSLERVVKSLDRGNRADQLFGGLAKTSKNLSAATEKLNDALEGGNLKGALRNLNGIMEKINNGTGTLGALVNDPSLYDDVKSLTGGANRNRIMRNLVRKTIRDAEAEEAKDAEKK